jgi:hypothetical protein
MLTVAINAHGAGLGLTVNLPAADNTPPVVAGDLGSLERD